MPEKLAGVAWNSVWKLNQQEGWVFLFHDCFQQIKTLLGYADSTVKAVISMEFFMFNKVCNIQCTYMEHQIPVLGVEWNTVLEPIVAGFLEM